MKYKNGWCVLGFHNWIVVRRNQYSSGGLFECTRCKNRKDTFEDKV